MQKASNFVTAITLANTANRDRHGRHSPPRRRKEKAGYFTAKPGSQNQEGWKHEKKNIIPCPLYNQHKMVLAVSSVLNKCFLVNSSNYRTSSLPLLEVYSQGQKGF